MLYWMSIAAFFIIQIVACCILKRNLSWSSDTSESDGQCVFWYCFGFIGMGQAMYHAEYLL